MSFFEQQTDSGWRCDGCGRVGPWGPKWQTYGSMAEQEEGILRWVACSASCAKRMPPALRGGPPAGMRGRWDEVRAYVEAERAKAHAARDERPAEEGEG